MTGRPVSVAPGLFGILLSCLTGCVTTDYQPYVAAREPSPFMERRVAYQVSGAFHRSPPNCAIVLPMLRAPTPDQAMTIERALARHLSQRLPRVIGPLERRRRARALAVDLARPGDRRILAESAACPALVEATLFEARDDYVVFWARRSLGLEVVMTRAADDTLLWRARHLAMRAAGGLPLSPVSVATTGLDATWFHADGEIADSLADDAVRRIAASLPDVR